MGIFNISPSSPAMWAVVAVSLFLGLLGAWLILADKLGSSKPDYDEQGLPRTTAGLYAELDHLATAKALNAVDTDSGDHKQTGQSDPPPHSTD